LQPLPIFLLTGHGITSDNEEIPAGIVDFLPKPINIEVLVDKITKAVKNDER
jgi:FixJ family two-component response regulator